MSNDPAVPRPVTLHSRTDINVKVDLQSRAVAFACAHPDGLLGAYEVVIPIHQIKRVAAMIQNAEGMAELREVQKMQRENTVRLLKPS